MPQHVAAYSRTELDEYKQRIISDTEYECLEEPIVIKKAINGMPVVLTMRSSNGHGQPVDEKRIWTVEFVRNSRYYNLTMECALADREAWFPIFDRIAHSLRTMPELEVPRATPVELGKPLSSGNNTVVETRSRPVGWPVPRAQPVCLPLTNNIDSSSVLRVKYI